jgi:L-amino acid N-acyltransferase YncA
MDLGRRRAPEVSLSTRRATPEDAAAIARIYNEGIEDRLATFETQPRAEADVAEWLEHGIPLVVAEDDEGVVAWAAVHPYRPAREAYRGVGEFSIYVARDRRGQGAGRAALAALIEEVEAGGYWKLLSRVFPENEASLALARSLGFRQVGVYRRHGRLDGEWRDVVIVEKLLGEAADGS